MAKKKKSSKTWGLSAFSNSPTIVKIFGPLLVVLMVAAAGYGVYTLVSEQFSNAANKKYGPWYHNSRGVKHDYGFAQSGERYGSPGKLWSAFGSSKDNNSRGYIWRGPGVQLSSGQYLGCFYYRLMNIKHTTNRKLLYIEEGKADLQVYFDSTKKVKRGFSDKGVTADAATLKSWKLRRTCLAFYVGKNNTNVSLRVKLNAGNMFIKKVKVTKITKKDRKLSNINLLKPRDNITWMIGGRYR